MAHQRRRLQRTVVENGMLIGRVSGSTWAMPVPSRLSPQRNCDTGALLVISRPTCTQPQTSVKDRQRPAGDWKMHTTLRMALQSLDRAMLHECYLASKVAVSQL